VAATAIRGETPKVGRGQETRNRSKNEGAKKKNPNLKKNLPGKGSWKRAKKRQPTKIKGGERGKNSQESKKTCKKNRGARKPTRGGGTDTALEDA